MCWCKGRICWVGMRVWKFWHVYSFCKRVKSKSALNHSCNRCVCACVFIPHSSDL
jgi:hypothetical protein